MGTAQAALADGARLNIYRYASLALPSVECWGEFDVPSAGEAGFGNLVAWARGVRETALSCFRGLCGSNKIPPTLGTGRILLLGQDFRPTFARR